MGFKRGSSQRPDASAIHKTIEELAERYIREIKLIQPEGPYHLPASVSRRRRVEMARQLAARGERVSSLFMFSANVRNNPHRTTGKLENGRGLSVWRRLPGACRSTLKSPIDRAS
jgi:thioesterase domain-containing protein